MKAGTNTGRKVWKGWIMRGLENMNKRVFESNNRYDFPDLKKVALIEVDGIENLKIKDFECARKCRYDCDLVHFFIDDYKFENVWKCPDKYIKPFQRAKRIIMPDFSIYYDMPKPLKVYNKYRNHWLARYFSDNGITVVPNFSVGTFDDYYWSIEGYPQNSVVAVSDIGVVRNLDDRAAFENAMSCIEMLKPELILYFTRSCEKHYVSCGNVKVVKIPYMRR